jgi:hypothetical protein
MLRKLTAAALIGAVTLSTTLPASASAWWYWCHPMAVTPFTPGTSAAAGVAATGGFIGFVAVLAGYDLYRRTTCNDFLGLGGPGFTTKITPASGNVMIPQCPPKRAAVVKVRG